MISNKNRDEDYIIGLIDCFLGIKAIRQATFEFLRGDVRDDAKPGKKGMKLPVDAYYRQLKLAVEYHELQHSEPVKFFDKPDKKTVSGVSRGEQRAIYDKRRRKVLPKHGIALEVLNYGQFECKSNKRLLRTENDQAVIKVIFDRYKNAQRQRISSRHLH